MRRAEARAFLAMRIPISGKLKSKARLRTLLEEYPALEQLSDGTCPRYLLKGDSKHFFIAEFLPGGIALEVHSTSSPLLLLNAALARLLSIASFVQQCYEFSLDGLFPYLAYALAKEGFHETMPSPAIPRGAELILSSRIISLKEQLHSISTVNIERGRKLNLVLLELLRMKCSGRSSVRQLAAEIGVAEDEIRLALRGWRDGRVAWHSHDLFTLVVE